MAEVLVEERDELKRSLKEERKHSHNIDHERQLEIQDSDRMKKEHDEKIQNYEGLI